MSEQTVPTVADPETEPAEVTDKPEVDWKAKAREWEKRAKANADAATRLAQLEESQKTEAQKLADAVEQHRRDADKARADLVRMQVALRHRIPEDDLDLLGDGDEAQIEARAQRLADLRAAADAAAAAPTRPRGDTDQGVRGSTLPLNGDPIENALRSKLGIT